MTPDEAWARLLGVDRLERLQVIVDAGSPVTRRGWIGILTIGPTVTVRVPRADLVTPLEQALGGLTPEEAADPAVVLGRLPSGLVRDTLGPAALFYPPPGYEPPVSDAEVVAGPELDELFEAASEDDHEESGITEIDSPTFGSKTSSGAVAAVAGYRVWPNGVAHLSVLTDAAHRNQGHARRAAAAAVGHAVGAGLLPQWRARPLASQRVALALGFERVGAQLGLQPAG